MKSYWLLEKQVKIKRMIHSKERGHCKQDTKGQTKYSIFGCFPIDFLNLKVRFVLLTLLHVTSMSFY